MDFRHISCMPEETLNFLLSEKSGIYLDATLGGGGHSERILKAKGRENQLICIDQDPDAINFAKKKFSPYKDRVRIVQANFKDIAEVVRELKVEALDGILADLGLSNHQLEASGRGFSFKGEEALDMRMNPESSLKAEDILNEEEEKNLKFIFQNYGEERFASSIARAIVNFREKETLKTTKQLVDIVQKTIPNKYKAKQKIHPATRVFMALRIAVNKELDSLDSFLEDAPYLLKKEGRMVVLSFHSLEDRRVKKRFKELSQACRCPSDFPICVCKGKADFKLVNSKLIRPGEEELEKNPMCRSTRLRALRRIS